MATSISELLRKMTPQEQTEVETFAAFVLTRRKLQRPELLTDDISTRELLKLVEDSGSFDWLNQDEEDVYSIDDGSKTANRSRSLS